MNFAIHDMLQALQHLTGTVSGSKFNGPNTLDYSYITPTIIALGEFSDERVDELLQLTHGDPVVLWNLGGKPLPQTVKLAFNMQIIDVPWKTPCQYTKAPLLQTVFSLCQSIKSWYDLHEKHLAIVHCPAGHPSTGIVIACLLKYIGAFDHAAHAYDFYCSKRLKGDPAHSLAPSYRNLFANVDKTVDNDGYNLTEPKYLKTITVAGLPVEDIPCVEVADINGTIYSSHVGWHANSSCTWNAEFGDGFYKVSMNIIGDFSIICRFGGHLSNNKDRSTLIFKYQNSTAFLTEEVLELKYGDVDINPQYADSLDVEIFTVHLMFENNPMMINRSPGNGKVKLTQFPHLGLEAFNAGLTEISQLHPVLPEAEKCAKLMELGLEEKYISISLQLSNNEVSFAAKLVDFIMSRTNELLGKNCCESEELCINSTSVSERISDDSKWEVVDLKCQVCRDESFSAIDQIVTCCNCQKNFHTFCVGLRRIPFGCKTEKDQIIREKYIRRHLGDWKCESCLSTPESVDVNINTEKLSTAISAQISHVGATTAMPVAAPTDSASGSGANVSTLSPIGRSKQDQIAILVAALSSGGIGIDELLSMSEDQQRESILSVMAKKYPELKFEPLRDSKGNMDLATAMQGILIHTNNPNPNETHKLLLAKSKNLDSSTAAINTKDTRSIDIDRQAFNISSENGVTKDELTLNIRANMLEVIKRRGIAKCEGSSLTVEQSAIDCSTVESPTRFGSLKVSPHLMSNIVMNHKTALSGNFSTADGRSSAISSLVEQHNGSSSLTAYSGASTNPTYPIQFIDGAATLNFSGQGSRPNQQLLTSLNLGSFGGNQRKIGNADIMTEGDLPILQSSEVRVKDIPEYYKYFKMIKAGIPKNVIAEKIVSDGTLSTPDMANSFLSLNPEEPMPSDFFAKLNLLVTLATHPKYEKFYKMLKVGISKDIVKAKMEQEGVNSTFLDKDPTEKVSLNGTVPQQLLPNNLALTNADESGNVAFVPLSEHPKYVKFFDMVKMGISIDVVKSKMALDNVDPNFLDKNPAELLPNIDGKSISHVGPELVPISEHPTYSKYYKMLKVGLPKESVQAKMMQENVDPNMIENSPDQKIPLDNPALANIKSDIKTIPLCQHPKYEKFFKMLKVGLPIPVVKNKMQMEGVDPTFIEKDPNELIPLEEDNKEEVPKVPAAEHPNYAKFFKMLKVGIPPEVIKGKMALEKLDPSILDSDPTALIPLEDIPNSSKGNVSKIPPKPIQRKKKLHWKAINQVNENSLWADANDIDIDLDEEEFNKLFVETVDKSEKKAISHEKKEVKKTKVVLIDMKRAQNGSIALARIKFSPDQLRIKIINMDDDGITTDQLKSMEEYLPNIDETSALKSYRGEKEAIGIAERYMLEMIKYNSASKCIQCMIYKQQFRGRYQECRSKIIKIQNACDDVKLSIRLKKVLKTILKIGNQLNDGEVHKGFTVDSLLKLQSAKAFDKKTTVLQYVVTLICRNDEDSLKFPEDLKHVSEASRFTFDTITTEKNTLRQEFNTNLKIVEEIRSKDLDSDTDAMLDFLTKADSQCSDLERGFEKAKEKFSGVLVYFGEDPSMSPQDFFSTLSRFIQEFIAVREAVDRVRKADLKRQQQQLQQVQQNDTTTKTLVAKASRRHNSLLTSSTAETKEIISNSKIDEIKIAPEEIRLESHEIPKTSVPDRASLLQEITKKPASRRKSSIL